MQTTLLPFEKSILGDLVNLHNRGEDEIHNLKVNYSADVAICKKWIEATEPAHVRTGTYCDFKITPEALELARELGLMA